MFSPTGGKMIWPSIPGSSNFCEMCAFPHKKKPTKKAEALHTWKIQICIYIYVYIEKYIIYIHISPAILVGYKMLEIVRSFSTWMSQEVSKWLVSGL